MPPKPADVGKSFMDQVLAKVPEADRAALSPHVQAIMAHEGLLTEIGGGTLRQDEFSRSMNSVQTERTRLEGVASQQTEWYRVNQALLEKARKAGITAEGDPNPDPADPTKTATVTAGLSAADVNKLLDERERGVVPFVAAVSTLALKHLQTFGEILDTDAILREAGAKNITLHAAYQAAHGERLAAKATEAENARIDKIVQERLVAERRTERSHPPDAIGGGSPLDVLEPAKSADGRGVSIDDLTDEYNRLVAAGAGAR